jgi:predicted dinucleotide-binding enzyme
LPETYAAGLGRVNRRRALTTGNVTARTSDLVPEQRALALRVRLCAMASGRVVAAFSRALAEQLRKQLHGRFPLTETDPPVGQDEP